jgi:stage II sporulation protein AA (anti-sigma F factor antagonist)
MGLGIDTETTDDAVAIVTLRGELTMAEADDLQAYLRPLVAAGRTQFVFDFSAAPFLDSGGLRVLVELYRDVQPLGGAIWIVGAAPVVRQTFEVTRLSTLLRLAPTREDALAQIRQTSRPITVAV